MIAWRIPRSGVAYTVWCKGQLVGETELQYARLFPTMRVGEFTATPKGEALIARIMEVTTGVVALGDVLKRDKERTRGPRQIAQLTEYADWVAAISARSAIELELRGPDGKVIPTESIDLRDTEVMCRLGAGAGENDDVELTPEEEEAAQEMMRDIEDLMGEADAYSAWRAEEESTLPRYQIFVELEDEWSIP